MYFDLGEWFGKSFFSTVRFKELYHYVKSQEGYEEYVRNDVYVLDYDDKKNENIERHLNPDELKNKIESGYSEINDSIKLLLNMILVYQTSIIEGVIRDCFKLIFLHNPKKIKYMNQKNGLTINTSIDIVLNSNTKEEILDQLAEDCAYQCNIGKTETILNRLNDLTGNKLTQLVLDRVKNIILERNTIIHELKDLSLSITDVDNAHEVVTDFLIDISKYFVSEKIQVFDPAHLLGYNSD
jgi:hypothetical protein